MHLFGNYSYGIILVVIAIVHFVRRRPNTFWLWIILMGGGLGALVYILVEGVPDLLHVHLGDDIERRHWADAIVTSPGSVPERPKGTGCKPVAQATEVQILPGPPLV